MIDVRWALERENDWRDVMRDLSRSADAVAEPAEKPARGWPFGLTGWRMYLNRTVEGYLQASKNNYEAGAVGGWIVTRSNFFDVLRRARISFPQQKRLLN